MSGPAAITQRLPTKGWISGVSDKIHIEYYSYSAQVPINAPA